MRKNLSVCLFVWVLAFCIPVTAFAEVKTVELRHASAEQLLPVVRDLLGPDVRVSGMNNLLIARGSSAELKDFEKIVRQLDTPRRMLRITVRQEINRAESGTRFDASGKITAGDMRVETGEVAREQDRLGIAGGGEIEVGAARRLGTARDARDQFILVLDGEQARITVGEALPYTREMAVLADRHGALGYAQGVDFQEVATGFLVRPLLQGEQVLLEVTPFLQDFSRSSSPVTGGARALTFHEAATRMLVPLGAWFDLGGHLQTDSEVGRSFVSWRTHQEDARRQILVRIDAEP
ncbi:secretin N-terminal domain-containing protein [Geoalkalibacter sp.]|uniref:secretin N-terminal domain-containing protein n=1 Tax=Geoalkalibacter sp. TaxID=3041440 RepID=UPI00272EB7EE|nr:secretin N-terminal domain-containing protein [Geoalkalibacter sp.]